MDGDNHHLVAGSLNLTMAMDLDKFRPFIFLGIKYIPVQNDSEIFASFGEQSNYKFKGTVVDTDVL
ncbi:MAG: hypothetical protein LBB13_01780 [Rickettsiales bacterium]|jgi:hypothetical protein|nr:hypothetical protein [Rickettsiales bacterium]